MGQYVGIERQAFGGHRPTLTPTSRWRAFVQDADG